MDPMYFVKLGIRVNDRNYGTDWSKVWGRLFYAALAVGCWVGIIWLFLWLGVRNWRPM